MSKRGPANPLTDRHKAAMTAGRREGSAVRAYLVALRNSKPKRGRPRTSDTIEARLQRVEAELANASTLDAVRLIQERRNLTNELESRPAKVDMAALEVDFVATAKSYSDRHAIEYDTWRDVGVQASVLARAGITRRRSPS
jgi:hypothetical protein